MKLQCSVVRAALVALALLPFARNAGAVDWRRLETGDEVVVATDDTEFFVDQAVASRLTHGTTLKVIELLGSREGQPKVWVGTSVVIDGKPKLGWVHSRKVFKPDNPASLEALKKFEGKEEKNVKIERDFLGNVLRIDANNSEITGAALAHVKGLYSLEGLELSGTKITDDDLAHLTGLSNLQWLYLDNTKISDKGLAHLQGLANLDVLALNKSEVTGPGLTNLKGLRQLRVVNLSDCKISDAALESIRSLTQIQTLAMQSLPITGEGLKHLEGLPRLNVVNLNHTKLNSGTLLHLKNCKELRILHLEGAKFDPDDKKGLDDAIPSLAIFD
jgi:hypothetical protein